MPFLQNLLRIALSALVFWLHLTVTVSHLHACPCAESVIFQELFSNTSLPSLEFLRVRRLILPAAVCLQLRHLRCIVQNRSGPHFLECELHTTYLPTYIQRGTTHLIHVSAPQPCGSVFRVGKVLRPLPFLRRLFRRTSELQETHRVATSHCRTIPPSFSFWDWYCYWDWFAYLQWWYGNYRCLCGRYQDLKYQLSRQCRRQWR